MTQPAGGTLPPAAATAPNTTRRLTKRRLEKVNPRTLNRLEKIRLMILGMVLVGLALFAWRSHSWHSARGEIYAALRLEDARRGLVLLQELDRQWGQTGEGYFLRARANRYFENAPAAELAIDQATASGYNRARLEHEQRLLEVQVVLPDIDPETAESTLTSYQADLDENALALIRGYLRLGQVDRAERLLEVWRTQQQENYRTRFAAGQIASKYSKLDDAKEHYEAAYAIEPNYVPLWLALGTVYWATNDPAKAYEFFERYAAARPDDPQGEGGRIETLLALGEYEKIVDFFQGRDEPLDVNSQARLFLAKSLSGLDRHQEVIDTLGPLIEAWPRDVEANQTLAVAYQALGQNEKAVEHANRAQEALPTNQRIPELRAAIAKDYYDAKSHAELGHILLHLSSRTEGMQHLMTALSLNPMILSAREDVAAYYDAAGMPERAAEFRAGLSSGTPAATNEPATQGNSDAAGTPRFELPTAAE